MKNTIGENLRKFRLGKGLTYLGLSKICGIQVSTLSALEHGRIQNPSFKNLEAIAEALGIPKEFLWEDSKTSPLVHKGDLKGVVQLDYKKEGLTLISYTPLMKGLFIGKGILKPKKTWAFENFKKPGFLFIELTLGKLEYKGEGKGFLLSEGENLSLRPPGNASLTNPFQMKESSFLVISSPSLVGAEGPSN